MNWDDLRYILAVTRAGTIVRGAKALRVSPTTMSRRLRALESEQGTALFEKFKHGAVLTGAGERMVAVAEQVEQLTDQLDAEIHGLDAKLAGPIRVTSTQMLLMRWLPDLCAFRERYPDIDLELISGISLANLTQREADVALRLTFRPPDHLVGRKHAAFSFAIYGSKELVARYPSNASYRDFPFVGMDPAVERSTDDWIAKHAPGARVVMRVVSMPVMVRALEAGAGITMLPCLLGDQNPALQRVGDYFSERAIDLWVLTHPQLRGSARIRTFIDAVRGFIERDRDLIEGRCPQPRD